MGSAVWVDEELLWVLWVDEALLWVDKALLWVDEALLWGCGSARLVIIREAVIAAKNFMATMRENRVD